jgi:hypothetical protein
MSIIMLCVVLFPVILFVCCNKITYKKPLTDEEILMLHRMNALLEGVTINNWREWSTLSIQELVDFFYSTVQICRPGDAPKNILYDIASRCETLSDFMEESQKQQGIACGITHLVKKPREVAIRLRLLADQIKS